MFLGVVSGCELPAQLRSLQFRGIFVTEEETCAEAEKKSWQKIEFGFLLYGGDGIDFAKYRSPLTAKSGLGNQSTYYSVRSHASGRQKMDTAAARKKKES